MSEISATGAPDRVLAAWAQARAAEPGAPASLPARPSDRVELSERARLLARLHEVPQVREDLVGRIRAEIGSGTYDTDDKFEAALDGLIEDADLPA